MLCIKPPNPDVYTVAEWREYAVDHEQTALLMIKFGNMCSALELAKGANIAWASCLVRVLDFLLDGECR